MTRERGEMMLHELVSSVPKEEGVGRRGNAFAYLGKGRELREVL